MTPLTPGIRWKLLALLLAFGVIPLATTIGVGYGVSRVAITRQAAAALDALAHAQAVHVATELDRERLILRTIVGQLPAPGVLRRTPPEALGRLLVQSLPEGGVFDGLRIVTAEGRVLASVALRNTAPHWPAAVPASTWEETPVVVHREHEQILAYLVAVPLGERTAWLEGHVRAEDFSRAFSLPQHLLEGSESAVFERDGKPVFGTHSRATDALLALLPASRLHSQTVDRTTVAGGAMLALAPVPETDWVFVSALPERVALAPLARLRNVAIAGAAGLVLLMAVTAVLAARSVTTPLRDLADAARRLGQEGLHRPIAARTSDEVGVVVASFNAMAADLQRSREEVERLHARDMARAQQLATVGELASGVAHEIRNPLTGVRGALELAMRRLPHGEGSRPLLEEAQQQLERIEGTTAQLLRYARPPELREIVTDVNLLVERATKIVAPQASRAGIALRTEPSPHPVTVRVDPELMIQVLVNLLLNGVEAMTAGGGAVTIWVARHAPEAWIGVRDTGPGVAAEVRGEIFRPFFTTKHQGTGLGLSISRQIVDRHGGTIRLEETPGGGATFVVALPLARSDGGGGDRTD